MISLATVVTAMAFVLWYIAVERLGAATAGLFAGLIPVARRCQRAGPGPDHDQAPASWAGALLVGAGNRHRTVAPQPPIDRTPSHPPKRLGRGGRSPHRARPLNLIDMPTIDATIRTVKPHQRTELS